MTDKDKVHYITDDIQASRASLTARNDFHVLQTIAYEAAPLFWVFFLYFHNTQNNPPPPPPKNKVTALQAIHTANRQLQLLTKF